MYLCVLHILGKIHINNRKGIFMSNLVTALTFPTVQASSETFTDDKYIASSDIWRYITNNYEFAKLKKYAVEIGAGEIFHETISKILLSNSWDELKEIIDGDDIEEIFNWVTNYKIDLFYHTGEKHASSNADRRNIPGSESGKEGWIILESSFVGIYENIKREYNFRIKTVSDISKNIDKIKYVLNKYDISKFGKIHKTILQATPMEFMDIDNAEVYILDVTVELPITAYVLMLELAAILNIPEKFIVVRGDNEPIEVEGNRIEARSELKDILGKLEQAPLLDTTEIYPEESLAGDKLSGDKYNMEFLKFISQQSHQRRKDEQSWDTTDEDFNAKIEGAPKSFPHWKNTGTPKDGRNLDSLVTHHGNIDDDASRNVIRTKNKKGSIKDSGNPIR